MKALACLANLKTCSAARKPSAAAGGLAGEDVICRRCLTGRVCFLDLVSGQSSFVSRFRRLFLLAEVLGLELMATAFPVAQQLRGGVAAVRLTVAPVSG